MTEGHTQVGERVGKVTHYFSKIGVAAISAEAPLQKGDRIRIQGSTTDVEEQIESLEVNHKPVDAAQPGDDVALKVSGKVREGDLVYRSA